MSKQSAIITGSNSGIGLGIATHFLAHGFNVVLHGRNTAKLEQVHQQLRADYGDRVASVAGDIADPSTGERLVNHAINQFGAVNVLVNNAGIFGSKAFLEVTESYLDQYLTGNLKGTFFTTQAAVRAMKDQGSGAIVNIGTVLVDHAMTALPATAPIVSKAGIHALTISLAAELAPFKIRVNLVAPGMVRSPLHGQSNYDELAAAAVLNEVGDPEDIAKAVLHLAESKFATGVILPIDGGYVTTR